MSTQTHTQLLKYTQLLVFVLLVIREEHIHIFQQVVGQKVVGTDSQTPTTKMKMNEWNLNIVFSV